MVENPSCSTLTVYTHGHNAECCTSNADQHPQSAILVPYTAGESSYSRLYFSQPCLDFQLYKAEDRIIFKDMHCLNYTQSLQKCSKKDLLKYLDPEGGSDQYHWRTEDLEFCLVNHECKSRLRTANHRST